MASDTFDNMELKMAPHSTCRAIFFVATVNVRLQKRLIKVFNQVSCVFNAN